MRRHDPVVTGTGSKCRAICRDCFDPEDGIQILVVARGSRNHVNRQARLHRKRLGRSVPSRSALEDFRYMRDRIVGTRLR